MRYRTGCTTKHENNELITHLGVYNPSGAWSYLTEAQVIRMIEVDGDTFYVERPTGHVVEVIVARREGHKYLKTDADGEKPNNLLSLPDCPVSSGKATVSSALGTVFAAASHGPSEW